MDKNLNKTKFAKRQAFDAMAFLSIIATLVYIIVRTTLFLFADYGILEKLFAALLICAEFFVLLHGIGYALNILRVRTKERLRSDEEALLNIAPAEQPSVAILVPARNEPKEILENTFITINNLNYQNKIIYLLDDSTEQRYKKEAEELCREYNLKLFRRTKPWHGSKAGIVNDCLETLDQRYIAIFDADQKPLPDFLDAIIPILEKQKDISFVQTPQFYSNIDAGPVARASALQQAVFYEYICEGKSISDSMFCCGTNVIFRAEALKGVGGLDETTITEDFATSIKLHAAGWRSLYYNHVHVFGMAPEDLDAYFKQQFRWAAGTISVFKKALIRLLTKPFSLKPNQWAEYLLSSTYYFVGIAFWVLMICPVLYLLFNVPSFFARPEIYIFAFLPYIFLSLGIFYIVLKKRHYSPRDLFLGQLLGVAAFSVYIRAAFSAIFGVKISFGVTSKTKQKSISLIRLWPQLSMLFLNFVAIVWGVNRFIYELEPAILVNGFWALYHSFVLSSIFYFNKERA